MTPPTLVGYLEPGRQVVHVRVWCDWCCIWHTHGAGTDGTHGDGHRVAHCGTPDSPYYDSGYTIAVSSVPFADVEKAVRQASAGQQAIIRDRRVTPAITRLRGQTNPSKPEETAS